MRRPISGIMVLSIAAVSLIVLAVTILFGLEIASRFVEEMSGVVGPGGVTPNAILTGDAFTIFATVGMLSIPGAIILYFFMANRINRQRRSRGGDSYVTDSDGPPPW